MFELIKTIIELTIIFAYINFSIIEPNILETSHTLIFRFLKFKNVLPSTPRTSMDG